MKNIVIKLSSLMAILVMLSACGEAELITYEADTFASFAEGTTGSYFVQSNNTPHSIAVGIPAPASSDVTVDVVTVFKSSDAHSIPATVTIPAGEVIGNIEIGGSFDALSGTKDTIMLALTGDVVASFDSTYTLYLQQFCPFDVNDFVGAWTANEVSAYNGAYDPYTVNFALGEDPNTLVTSDIWPFAPVNFVFDDSDPAAFKFEIPDTYMFTHETYGDVYMISVGDCPFSACDKLMGPFDYKVYVPGLGNFDYVTATFTMDPAP